LHGEESRQKKEGGGKMKVCIPPSFASKEIRIRGVGAVLFGKTPFFEGDRKEEGEKKAYH